MKTHAENRGLFYWFSNLFSRRSRSAKEEEAQMDAADVALIDKHRDDKDFQSLDTVLEEIRAGRELSSRTP